MSVSDFETLGCTDYINEIIPVGSKGIAYEIQVMCDCNNISFIQNENIAVDLKKSGGPSCSCIVSIEENNLELLKKLVDKPMEILGRFEG